jgi:hypothetical protein
MIITSRAPSRPAAAPAAPPVQARTGRTLKLYVDSTSLSLVQQMADFVACADSPDTIKLITWLRLPLDKAQLKQYGAVYAAQRAAVSPAFVQQVCESVRRQRFEHIELHTNQYQAWRGALPLLRSLAPLAQSLGSRLTLELYDDGIAGPLQREKLKASPDPEAALAAAGAELKRAVFDGAALEWGIAHSYAWQYLLPARYHLLKRELLLRDTPGRALHAVLEKVVTDMRFDGLPHLSEAQQALYLQLFGLDATVGARLAELAARSDAMVFTATATRIKEDNLHLRNGQLKAIAALRAGGVLDACGVIAYKGHPANGEYDADMMAALGEGTVALPPRVPLEVLMMAGLLPWQVGGTASSSFCTLPPERIAFMLCEKSALHGGRGAPMLQLMLDSGMVDPARVLPLLD